MSSNSNTADSAVVSALSKYDASALICGRFVLAYGQLDFRIETLIRELWGYINERLAFKGIKFDDFPKDGRSGNRWSLLRKYLCQLSDDSKDAISAFDSARFRHNAVFKLRGALFHGMSHIAEDQGEYVIHAYKLRTDEGMADIFDVDLSKIKLGEILENTREIKAIEDELCSLVTSYKAAYFLKTAQIKDERPYDRY